MCIGPTVTPGCNTPGDPGAAIEQAPHSAPKQVVSDVVRKAASARRAGARAPTGGKARRDANGRDGGEARDQPSRTPHRAQPNGQGRGGLKSYDRQELIDDFRLACLSRALDDREILLQKQSRVFFQISGAGHEVLLLALVRSCSGSASRRFRSCCKRSAPHPTPRRADGRCPVTGATSRATSSPSRAQPGASACRRWVAPRPAATS